MTHSFLLGPLLVVIFVALVPAVRNQEVALTASGLDFWGTCHA